MKKPRLSENTARSSTASQQRLRELSTLTSALWRMAVATVSTRFPGPADDKPRIHFHAVPYDPPRDERHFAEIDAAMLFIEEARRRTERAVAVLRAAGAEPHLIAALEATEAELSEVARKLRQGTLFAVPSGQLSL